MRKLALLALLLLICGCGGDAPQSINPYSYEKPDVGYKTFEYNLLYQIKKNPAKYTGKLYAFKGEVIQSHESEYGVAFQILTANRIGSSYTGPGLMVYFTHTNTGDGLAEKDWVRVLGHIDSVEEGENAYGGYVRVVRMNAIAVDSRRTGIVYSFKTDKEIVDQWSDGTLFRGEDYVDDD